MFSEKKDTTINNVAIRPLTRFDAQDLHQNCFPEESPEAVTEYVQRALHFMEQGRAAHLVAESDGHAVANAQIICWRERAEIGSLVVSTPWRGNGIGTALIEALGAAAAELGAEQIEIGADGENRRLIDLYRRLGFTVQKRVRLSENGVDDDCIVYLVKPLARRN